ncbi:hypothetical protein EMN47_04160 [Prolixibacteraceae bacterium JC049]|nr:hypothetical protein [Prolixibacteraceae bacterium JC049]
MTRKLTLLLCLFFGITLYTFAQTVIYSEDFNSYSNGTTQGSGTPAKWTLDETDPNIESTRTFSVQSNVLEATFISQTNIDPRGIGYWLSQSISISGYTNVSLSVEVLASPSGMESSEDLVRCEYSIDGGAWTTFSTNGLLQGNIASNQTATQTGLSGSAIQLRVAMVNDLGDETYKIDNVSVSGTLSAASPVIWMRANDGVTLDGGSGINNWLDQASGYNLSSTNSSNNGPYLRNNRLNFNPIVEFDGNDLVQSGIPGSVLDATSNTALLVQKFNSGYVIFSLGQYNPVDADRRFSMESSGGNIRFDFPNDNDGDGKLIGSTSITGSYQIQTLASTATQNKIYVNNVLDATSNRTSTFNGSEGQHSIRIGTSNQFGGYYSRIDVAELILFDSELIGTNFDIWQSYLGLKYAITVGNDGSSFVYLDSSGNTIWDGATTFQNNVVGLGNDSGWSLDQKVASSGDVVMATTSDFSSGNYDSGRTSLSGGQFLIWGDNGGSTGSWNVDGSYNRVNKFWKVQNTGSVSTVNLQINLSSYVATSSEYKLIVDNDNNLSNGITSEHALTNSSGSLYTTSLSFADGTNYFTIAESLAPETGFWVRADAATSSTTDGNTITSWGDQSGSNNATTSGSNSPTFRTNQANFNPGIDFDGSNDRMTINRPAQDDFTFAIVVRSDDNGGSGSSWWQGDGIFDGEVAGSQVDFGGLSLLDGKLAFGTTGNDQTVKSSASITGSTPHFAIATRSASNGAKALFIDGSTDNTGTGITGSITNPTGFRIGSLYSNNNYYNGTIFEIITFNGVISGLDKSRLETYFALKYGLTLSSDYVASEGTIYSVSGYGNNIAGLVNGTAYSLDQKVASTINTSSSDASNVTMATTSDFTSTNQTGSRTSLSSGQYLIWGDNGGSTSSWTNDGGVDRVNRFWKVQNTGNVGSIHLEINLQGYPATSNGYSVIVDSDNNLSNGVTGVYSLTNSSGDLYNTQATFPQGTSYFTIGVVPPLVVTLDSYTNISSNGGTNGVLTVSATGGLGSYSYSWSNGASTNSITGLSSGAYTVTVTSGTLSTQQTYYLYDPDLISSSTTVVSSPNCAGDQTGEINLSVTLPNTKCINFDGSNDYVALNDSKSGQNAFAELTVCAWIKVPAGQGGWAVLDYDRSEYFNVSIGDQSGGDNTVHFDTNSGINGNIHDFNGSVVVADNTWHHIACVYDGVNKHIYVDGVLDASTSSPPHNSADIGSTITRYGFIGEGSEADGLNGTRNNLYFQGKIALVELWTRALGEQEIRARMNSSASGTGLVGLWKLDEGSGTSTTAVVGGNGTLYGSPAWETDSFYSVSSYAWTKNGDGGFSESTQNISSLSEGTYNYSVQVTNGYTITGSQILNAAHQNISTNAIQIE